MRRTRGFVPLVVVLAGWALVASGCAAPAEPVAATGGPRIVLLLPESRTARYETRDRPRFYTAVKTLCPDCQVLVSNAEGDPARQQAQAESAIADRASALVVVPVDSTAATSIVTKAKAAGIPVMAYGRRIPDAPVDVFVGFDVEAIGRMQAEYLADRLAALGTPEPSVVMINGDPADDNAPAFEEAARDVFDARDISVAAEYDTPGWNPSLAERHMALAIGTFGADGIDGVYAANDGTAGGAVAALQEAGVTPLPPVTGQDAELAALRRLLLGQQYMTVLLDIDRLADAAALIAVTMARGEALPPDLVRQQVPNGAITVPAALLDPVAVTAGDIAARIIEPGIYSVEQLCTPDVARACEATGLRP